MLYSLALLSLCASTLGQLVNRTIDDQFGDEVTHAQVTYSPPGFWSQGADCSFCTARPDTSQVLNGTWHDTTHIPGKDNGGSITFSFSGSAVYVFVILQQSSLTNVTFSLDGNPAGGFINSGNFSEKFLYNVPILSQPSIPFGAHSLSINVGGPSSTLVLFDYAIYTTNPNSSPSSGSTTSSPSASPLPGSIISKTLPTDSIVHTQTSSTFPGSALSSPIISSPAPSPPLGATGGASSPVSSTSPAPSTNASIRLVGGITGGFAGSVVLIITIFVGLAT